MKYFVRYVTRAFFIDGTFALVPPVEGSMIPTPTIKYGIEGVAVLDPRAVVTNSETGEVVFTGCTTAELDEDIRRRGLK